MKQSLTSRFACAVVAVGLSAALLPATSGATTVFQDMFPTNGNLAGSNGWLAHSGGGAKIIPTLNGRATLTQSAGSGEDVNHPFAVQGLLAKTYMSFTLNIPAGSVVGTGTEYFVHFRPNTPDTNNFVTRVFIAPPTAGGDYNIGVGSGSLTTTPFATWGSGLTFGTSYRIVAAYDPVLGGSQMWVNPDVESSTSIATAASPTVINKPLASIAVRQATPAGANLTQLIGQVTVATTFDEVALDLPVPGVGTWGLGALAAGLLGAGAVFAMRRRNAVALG